MGRHGGGSSGGGGGGWHGRSGHSYATSSGIYHKSYIHNGQYYSIFTNDKDYGTKASRVTSRLWKLILCCIFVLGAFCSFLVNFDFVFNGEKINGNPERIIIRDTIDLLTPAEEQNVLDLFHKVYAVSGMPVTLHTDNMEWTKKYSSIEIYSEKLYYDMGTEENAMIILFIYDGTSEWIYDMYCGDDTIKCLSDSAFRILLDHFQQSMEKQDLYHALNYSFNSIMGHLAQSYIETDNIVIALMLAFVGYAVIFRFLSPYLNEKRAYMYYLEKRKKEN